MTALIPGEAVPLPSSEALRRALALYRPVGLGVTAFVTIRHWLAPIAAVLDALPAGGRLLDVGCGHGLFANAAALACTTRTVVGIDPSPVKIGAALAAGRAVSNVSFVQGVVQDAPTGPFDAISILDVLYLLPVEQKLAILRACRERIAVDGVLLLKANDTAPRWKYQVARAQEVLMTRVGLTLGHGDLHFLSREQNAALLELAGFRPTIHVLETWLPYPHVLITGVPA
ncbi:MAG: class I SAM-dependent methyltransferase [Chloroflexota bacterium]